ncbi:helix-turn-helix domain-containing protein [Hydrogenoanaerobacterium sp.]|uniref:AraC family transcriptional regulator n=1 Tax=Hydrogenoanaerobacterium sp. TaxID=2953763 RepID=UPI0037BFC56F
MSNLRYDFKEGDVERINANLMYVSSSKYEGDWNSIPHIHPFAELFYVINGTGSFLVENKSFEVRADDFIIVNPNVLHTEMSLNAAPLEYIVIGVSGLSFLFGDKQDIGTFSVQNYKSHRKDFLFYLNILLTELAAETEYSQIVCQNLFEVLLVNMVRQSHFSFAAVGTQKSDRECSIAKRYIDANFKENISLDDLAKLTHTNKYYLAHSFSKSFGVSPINYLLKKRIDESKMLLSTTNHSVSQIAQIVGFSSPSYFSQAFVKAAGQPPSQYRKELRTANKK